MSSRWLSFLAGRGRWLLMSMVVGALALGITGGAVLAQGDEGDSGSVDSPATQDVDTAKPDHRQRLLDEVASILGIEAEQLQDAFKQAQETLRKEALQQRLDRMVAAGVITPEQADDYQAWLEARPDVPRLGLDGHHRAAMGRFKGPAFHGGPRGGFHGGHGFLPPRHAPPANGDGGTES